MIRAAASRVAWPLAAAACLASAAALAQDATPDASAPPQPSATVRDPDFGVAARHYGLERQVEMYQWRGRPDGGYDRAWSSIALDSSGYAPGHDNPPFPLRSRRWVAGTVEVDGVPLDPAVLSELGRWTPFRPGFSALPGNLAATFQPQGDGLGTAEDPMAPQVGDLRLHWRDLRLPPLSDRIVLAEGRWRLKARPSGAAAAGGVAANGHAAAGAPRRSVGAWALVAFLVLVAVAFGVARMSRRRR